LPSRGFETKQLSSAGLGVLQWKKWGGRRKRHAKVGDTGKSSRGRPGTAKGVQGEVKEEERAVGKGNSTGGPLSKITGDRAEKAGNGGKKRIGGLRSAGVWAEWGKKRRPKKKGALGKIWGGGGVVGSVGEKDSKNARENVRKKGGSHRTKKEKDCSATFRQETKGPISRKKWKFAK